jgi:tyrosine phenol-lyase
MQPYRIKVVEPIPSVSPRKRKTILGQVGYNMFMIPSKYVAIDLISDSGTGAMSADQWAEVLRSREDFAGQTSFDDFTLKAQKLTGLRYIQPVHQGRTAENLLFKLLLKKGDAVVANSHFETTRANIEALKCRAIDLPSDDPPFLGNIAINKLQRTLRQQKRVKLIVLTVTSNVKGGQPVSLQNIAITKRLARAHKIPLILDACRFADNAYLIRDYSKTRANVANICKRMFRYSDIVYMSNKKDGLVNIGGFIGLRSRELYERLRYEVIRQEAYPSSGGLAARDVAAMTLGLVDAVNDRFLHAHISSIRFLAENLKKNRVPIFEPVGGHAIVILPKSQPYYSFSLAAQVYLETGIRGGVFEKYFRLAVPRRVYTSEHLQYVADAVGSVYARQLPRLKLVNRPREFFNFFARFSSP